MVRFSPIHIMVVVLFWSSIGFCQLSDNKTSGSVSNVGQSGSSVSWSGLGNTTSIDRSTARTADLTHKDRFSDYLTFQNFGFSIPATSNILGISVTIVREANGGTSLADQTASLLIGGAATGSNLANGSNWSTSPTSVSYGGSTNKWGNTLTPAIVNASGFGFRFSVVRTTNSGTSNQNPELDFMRITVHYQSTLPIELMEFKSFLLSNKAKQVSWSTATETNTNDYDIERSTDGFNFAKINNQVAAGTSINKIEYSYIDRDFVSEAVIYYRLIQRDLNGDETIYGPISLATNEGISSFETFPNPSSDWVNFRWDKALDPKFFILYSSEGKQIERQWLDQQNRFSFAHLPAGNYLIFLLDENNVNIGKTKFVKL